MKKCFKCNVMINTNTDDCPLCNTPLNKNENGKDVFPILLTRYRSHELFYKILLLASIFGGILCLAINYLVSKDLKWSYFVIAGIVSFWITLIAGVRRRHYFLRMLFTEFNIILLVSFISNYFTGFNNLWSLTYVLPFISVSYILSVFITRIFLKSPLKDYIIYIYINCLIGIIPIILVFKDVVKVAWPSIISASLSVFLMLILFIFNRKQVTQELERRFHF
ncbi:MAG: DUF6320 domain-containing protein [Bacilli bacterium]